MLWSLSSRSTRPTRARVKAYREKHRVDVAEIYAGVANITRMASEYGLVVLQPVEKDHGACWETKKEIREGYAAVVQHLPLVTVIGIMCTPWTKFARRELLLPPRGAG